MTNRVCSGRCMNQGIECHFENALARPKKLKYSAYVLALASSAYPIFLEAQAR